jgi:excisionase family DNA binding protein
MQNKIFEQEKKDFLSIGEASEYLGISIDTLRRWEKKERITAYRSPGGHRYFQKEDLKGLFNARYTRDAPTIRGKKETEPEIKTEAIKPEVEEEVVAKPRIIIEEKSVSDSKTVHSTLTEKTETVDWSEKYANKQARKVRIPLTRPVAIRTSHIQTVSNQQSVQQIRSGTVLSQPPLQSSANTLVPPSALQLQVVQDNQFSSSTVQQSVSPPVQQINSSAVQSSPNKSTNNLSKRRKMIISVALIIVLISLVIFFYWYSRPKILSPIP